MSVKIEEIETRFVELEVEKSGNNEPISEESIVVRLAENNAIATRSLQKDDLEPTFDLRKEDLKLTLTTSPIVFLERYGVFLSEAELLHLQSLSCLEDNFLQFLFNSKLSNCRHREENEKKRHQLVRNRRFIHLTKLEKNGYMSDENMKNRDKELYEQYIGQYLSEKERTAMTKNGNDASKDLLSTFLFQNIDMSNESERKKKIKSKDYGSDEEEFDTESEDETEFTAESATDNQRLQLRIDLEMIFRDRFLQGMATDVCYDQIDNCEDLDFQAEAARDLEDAYFDED